MFGLEMCAKKKKRSETQSHDSHDSDQSLKKQKKIKIKLQHLAIVKKIREGKRRINYTQNQKEIAV